MTTDRTEHVNLMLTHSSANFAHGTVMFVDLVGYLPATLDFDLERALRFVEPLLVVMIKAVTRCGGRTIRLMGDGLLALFEGENTKCQNAALEAARITCLAMQEMDCECRISLNTGPVYVGPLGCDLYSEIALVGTTVDIAAKLLAQAGPSQVVVGCTDQIGGLVGERVSIQLKGTDRTVSAVRISHSRAS